MIRQDGILAPFNLYIDNLSKQLNALTGCIICYCLNHLTHADYLLILTPSSSGFQQLFTVCSVYRAENDNKYTVKANKIAVLKRIRHWTFPFFNHFAMICNKCNKISWAFYYWWKGLMMLFIFMAVLQVRAQNLLKQIADLVCLLML